MFSVSDIREEAYPATFRKGKDLYETGAVLEMKYDIYPENGSPMADISARVRGTYRDFYNVEAIVDEDYDDVTNMKCDCEAFYNYEGMCKHCVAALLS
jgi:uncharacterized Zn finger protein